MQNFRVELTNWAHALATWIGSLVAAAGGAATVATFFGAHIDNLPSIQGNGALGFIIALASKFIDSAHNAATTIKAPPTVITNMTNTNGPLPLPTPAQPAPAPSAGLG